MEASDAPLQPPTCRAQQRHLLSSNDRVLEAIVVSRDVTLAP